MPRKALEALRFLKNEELLEINLEASALSQRVSAIKEERKK